jgi:hypothetical protein
MILGRHMSNNIWDDILQYVDALKATKDGEVVKAICIARKAENDTEADVREALGVGDAAVRASHEAFAKRCLKTAAKVDDIVADVAYVIRGAGKDLLDYLAKPTDIGISAINSQAAPDRRVDAQNR